MKPTEASRKYRPIQPWVAVNSTCEHGLRYREHPIPKPWDALFHTVWTLHGGPLALAEECSYHIVPDACSDVVFDLAKGGGTIFGTFSRPQGVRMTGTVRILGVRMLPHVASALWGLSAAEIRDFTPTFEQAGVNQLTEMLDQLMGLPGGLDPVQHLFSQLGAVTPAPGLSSAGNRLMAATLASGGSVERAARAMGLCPRQMHRVCLRELGLPPKLLGRVLRVQQALPRVCAGREGGAEVAVTLGFADQAHMVREFDQLTGFSPKFWRDRMASARMAGRGSASLSDPEELHR